MRKKNKENQDNRKKLHILRRGTDKGHGTSILTLSPVDEAMKSRLYQLQKDGTLKEASEALAADDMYSVTLLLAICGFPSGTAQHLKQAIVCDGELLEKAYPCFFVQNMSDTQSRLFVTSAGVMPLLRHLLDKAGEVSDAKVLGVLTPKRLAAIKNILAVWPSDGWGWLVFPSGRSLGNTPPRPGIIEELLAALGKSELINGTASLSVTDVWDFAITPTSGPKTPEVEPEQVEPEQVEETAEEDFEIKKAEKRDEVVLTEAAAEGAKKQKQPRTRRSNRSIFELIKEFSGRFDAEGCNLRIVDPVNDRRHNATFKFDRAAYSDSAEVIALMPKTSELAKELGVDGMALHSTLRHVIVNGQLVHDTHFVVSVEGKRQVLRMTPRGFYAFIRTRAFKRLCPFEEIQMFLF